MCVCPAQIRNVETNQCLDNMARKENEKVGIFNCHGMGGNQVWTQRNVEEVDKWFEILKCGICLCYSAGFLLHGQ